MWKDKKKKKMYKPSTVNIFQTEKEKNAPVFWIFKNIQEYSSEYSCEDSIFKGKRGMWNSCLG